MDLSELIEALNDPAAYPFAVDEVVVHQTHISAVFLAGPFAYKIKKPVDFGFLNFQTLDLRRHFCAEEVRLNRRLARGVYFGVVPVTLEGDRLAVEGRGEVVEWAVKMKRLPEEATLAVRLQKGEATAGMVQTIARRIADFHHTAESGPRIAESARFEVVARNALENLQQAEGLAGVTVSRVVLDRLRERTETALELLRPLIESRADRGVPRDTHGDLRCEHVYVFPDREPPDDLVIVDAIEFQERFRHADPIADIAFLVMDLEASGRRDLAGMLADSYIEASGDEEGRALLPLYVSYRAAVRGKVEGLALRDQEIPEADRALALAGARGHWLLALGTLERPGDRAGLVLVSGLPGAGKSTLARALADRAGFEVIRSDVVRKELAGLDPEQPANADWDQGIYTPEWTERTYSECLRRAEARLFEGRRVIVDATFGLEAQRSQFLEAATRLGMPGLLLICRAAPETIQARLRLRGRGQDASDADLAIHRQAVERWEDWKPTTQRDRRVITTDDDSQAPIDQALQALSDVGLSR